METAQPTPETENRTFTFNAQTPPADTEQRPKPRRRSRNSMPAVKRKRDERSVDERMNYLTLAPRWKRWILLPFQLMELPIELREHIYHYAMSNYDETDSTVAADASTADTNQRALAIRLQNRHDSCSFGKPGNTIVSRVYPHVAALLGTSRQVRAECIPIFFRVNKFNFFNVLSLPRVIDNMGGIARNNMQRLELRLWGVVERDTLLYHLQSLDLLPRLRQVILEFSVMTIRSMKVRLEVMTDSRNRYLCTPHGGKTEAVRRAELRTLSSLNNLRNRVRITVAICSPLITCHCHENCTADVPIARDETQNSETESEPEETHVRAKVHWEPNCMACSIVKGLEHFVDSQAYIKKLAEDTKQRIDLNVNYCPPKLSGLPELQPSELEQTAFRRPHLYPLLKSEKAIPKSTWISKSSRDSKGSAPKVIGVSGSRD